MMKPILLASPSPDRRTLLQRLGRPFSRASPDNGDAPQPAEAANAPAVRPAAGTAEAPAREDPDTLISGSDQVASLPGRTLHKKPGDHGQAALQRTRSSGNSVRFLTGLAVLH